MLATTAGDFQMSALGVFRDLRAAGVRAVSGEVKTVTIGPDLRVNSPVDAVAIVSCMNGRSLRFYRQGRFIRNGIEFKEYFVARTVRGKLRLWTASSEVVEAC